ncbi:hypothetical protein [Bacteriophage sp.]|nr:hypothetical protein [Bacteriophage sp.]UOF80134.1 hypothetical protein [Bacteriophage sp.]
MHQQQQKPAKSAKSVQTANGAEGGKPQKRSFVPKTVSGAAKDVAATVLAAAARAQVLAKDAENHGAEGAREMREVSDRLQSDAAKFKGLADALNLEVRATRVPAFEIRSGSMVRAIMHAPADVKRLFTERGQGGLLRVEQVLDFGVLKLEGVETPISRSVIAPANAANGTGRPKGSRNRGPAAV